MHPVHLREWTPAELARLWPDLPLDPAVARRVVERLVHADRDDLVGIRGLSRALEARLAERADLARLRVLDRRASERDPFVKYLFEGADGSVFEAVRIPLLRPRWSVCVSSQAGCAYGCAFCETGRVGFRRDLRAWEIVEQVLTIRREAPERPVTGVVFQGQGEPLANYDAVIRAASMMRDPNGLRIRAENVTISTVGLLPAIERFTEEGHVFRLILSLTSAFDDKRAVLVPSGRRWPVADLAEAMRRHAARRGGPVHLAWVLIDGLNTGEDEAGELARLFRGVPLRVHVIEVNDPSGRFVAPTDHERKRFLAALGSRGIPFVRRYSGGADIRAACGQLAASALGGRDLSPASERGPA